MASTNSVTGDAIVSKFGNKEARERFENNFDAIFGKKKPKADDDWNEKRIDVIGQNGNTGEHYERLSKKKSTKSKAK